MKLEEELQTKGFDNEHQKAFLNVLFTAEWLRYRINKWLDQYDLTHEQYNVMRIVRGQHPNPVHLKSITERMINRYCNATRIVDRLLEKELMTKQTCPSDRRALNIKLSDKGLQLMGDIDAHIQSQDMIPRVLNEDESKVMNDLLDRLRDAE